MRGLFSFFLLLSLVLSSQSAQSQEVDAVALPGWTRESDDERSIEPEVGIILDGGKVDLSSAVIAEIDGNTENGKEVAVATEDGYVHVYLSDGSQLWRKRLPKGKCVRDASNDRTKSGPAVGDLFGNGVPYVVVGYGGFFSSDCGGGVVAFRGSNGRKRWHFNLKRFARQEDFFAVRHAVYGSPALADLDGDGRMEVGFGSFDRNVYLLEANGQLRWYYHAADTVWSSPAFANVNRDRDWEMIIGTDISANDVIRPPTENGGFVYALKANPGRTEIPFRSSSGVRWKKFIPQTIFSSPVVADVLMNRGGAEIIVGTGCFFEGGESVYILNRRMGKVLNKLPMTDCVPSSVAVGDIDEDGVLEIIVTENDGFLSAWNAEESEPIWRIRPEHNGQNDRNLGDFKSPVVADLDGNGSLEIVVSNKSGVVIVAGKDGSQLTCPERSCEDGRVRLPITATTRSTPAVGDIDGDGDLDLVIAGSNSGSGALYAWTDFADYLGSEEGTLDAYSAPWPMWRGNPRNTGNFRDNR